jgi:hypothetical protein
MAGIKSKPVVMVGAITVLLIIAVAYAVRSFTGWETVTVELDLGSSLEVSRKPKHPFLAEYERKVAVVIAGRHSASLTYVPDVGGGFPMLIRFYADDARRVVRLTDNLNDRLIDLSTGQFVPEETPPPGKESGSWVREAELPPLKRSTKINEEMRVVPAP